MVAKFISVDDFAIRAGLGAVDDLQESVQTKARYAIEAATTHLVSYIRTEFDAVTDQRDVYYVDSHELPFVGEFPSVFLSYGNVTTAVGSLQVRSASLLNDLTTASALSTDYLVLNADKGTVMITGTDQLPLAGPTLITGDRFFLDVTYDAGFQTQADAYGTIYVNAPQYLAEAAMILALSIFQSGQPCKDGEATGQNGCPCTIENLITRYIRFAPSALKPIGH